MRVALVGVGYWGSKLRRVLKELGHDIVAEIDRDGVYVIGETDADAAVIATPPGTHFEIAMAAMLSGMDVLVEKPMATSYTDAATMQAYAQDNRRVLSVDHTFVHSDAFDFFNKIEEPLRYYQSIRLAPPMPQAVIPASWDLVVHDFGILHALGAEFIDGYGSQDEDVAQAVVQLNGGSAFIMGSRAWPLKQREITMHFPSSAYLWSPDGWSRLDPSGAVLSTTRLESIETLKKVINDFEIRCEEREIGGITDGAHGAEVVGWLERMYGQP